MELLFSRAITKERIVASTGEKSELGNETYFGTKSLENSVGKSNQTVLLNQHSKMYL